MRIYLKRPNGRRKSFAIYKREGNQNITIKCPDLDALNTSDIDPDIKLKNALEIKKRVEREYGIASVAVHNDDNDRIVEQYWRERYIRRELVDTKTARYEIERAVKALGNLSLVSASEVEIENHIKSKDWPRNKRRRVLIKIQILLKYLGRDIKLVIPPEEQTDVRHIDEDEFKKRIDRVRDEHLRALFNVLFHTGMRLGEAFGLTKFKVRDDYIVVDTQIDKHDKIRKPKCEKTRKTFVQDMSYVREWLKVKDSFPYGRTNTNKLFKRYFPRMTIHDLRHSYAINLLSKGVPIAHVAQSLGNSVRVCERYYTGFELADKSIALMKRLVNE